MSVYDEWMQWLLGVCKDMYVECVWILLGECKCDRLSRYLCKLLCVTIYNESLFEINCQTVIKLSLL